MFDDLYRSHTCVNEQQRSVWLPLIEGHVDRREGARTSRVNDEFERERVWWLLFLRRLGRPFAAVHAVIFEVVLSFPSTLSVGLGRAVIFQVMIPMFISIGENSAPTLSCIFLLLFHTLLNPT